MSKERFMMRLLTLLGFAGTLDGCTRLEYGSVYTTFRARGQVTSSTDRPIEYRR